MKNERVLTDKAVPRVLPETGYQLSANQFRKYAIDPGISISPENSVNLTQARIHKLHTTAKRLNVNSPRCNRGDAIQCVFATAKRLNVKFLWLRVQIQPLRGCGNPYVAFPRLHRGLFIFNRFAVASVIALPFFQSILKHFFSYTLFAALLCLCIQANAQTTSVANAAGGVLSGPGGSLEYSVGEPLIEALSDGQSAVTQGFIQPDYIACAASLNKVGQVICAGETYVFNGLPLQIAGIYETTFTAQSGCDSTVRLTLVVRETQGFAVVNDMAELILPASAQTLAPLANDALPAGLSPVLASFSQPAQGQLTMNDSTTLTYALLNSDFTRLDSFRYTVCFYECLQPLCDTALVYISVRKDFGKAVQQLLPNALTPNGDGLNDSFDPLPILWDNGLFFPTNSVSLTVFNRWGEVVYHVMEYRPWDGKETNGNLLPHGTYYYALKLSSLAGEQVLRGAVHLLR